MMGNKYFTLSFDDGIEQDKRLTHLMRQYGIKGTFNINSGLFGDQHWIIRMGNLSVGQSNIEKKRLLSKHEVFRLSEQEIIETYQGFEIASHTASHKNLWSQSRKNVRQVIEDDIAALQKLTNQDIKGFAYPYGSYRADAKEIIKENGIFYAHVALNSKTFDFPEDPLNWRPTSWIIQKNVMAKLDAFIDSRSSKDQLFCLWGHGYELDYGTQEASWEKIERIFQKVAGRDDIIFCTNREAFESRL